VGGQPALQDAVAAGVFEDGQDGLHGAEQKETGGAVQRQALGQVEGGQRVEGALEATQQGGQGGRFRWRR
jgi:hypothetical protein